MEKENLNAMKTKKTKRKENEVLQTLWKTIETFHKVLFKQCASLKKALDASHARQEKLEERLSLKPKTTLRKSAVGKTRVG